MNGIWMISGVLVLILISFMVNAANTHISASQDQGTTVIVLGAKINADQPSLTSGTAASGRAGLC